MAASQGGRVPGTLSKLAVGLVCCAIIGPFFWVPLTIASLFISPYVSAVVLAYLVYVMFIDKSVERPGPAPLKRSPIWKYYAQYFPITLIPTAPVDASRNHLFCLHPHGVCAFSHFVNFATDATGFSKLFPGLKIYLAILDVHMRTPVQREMGLMHGMRSCTRKSCVNILNGPPGSCLALITGGADEALRSEPGQLDLVLNDRLGFVRVALRTGASLVPVIAFGENSLYTIHHVKPGGLADRAQKLFFRITKFGIPFFYGSGMWFGYGLLPWPHPVHTVVGKPLQLPKYEGSLKDARFQGLQIEWHAKYIAHLKELYNQHKDKYPQDCTKGMLIE